MSESDPFRSVVEKLQDELDKIGLYTVNMHINRISSKEGGDNLLEDVRSQMVDDDAKFFIAGTFQLGPKIAFSDRVQYPDRFDTDKQFAMMMPTEDELAANRAREAFERMIETGDDEALFSMFDDIEDDDDA
jgi:hypothetical protein